jgi:glycosyltransferase involved in cell wall biosynthesis
MTTNITLHPVVANATLRKITTDPLSHNHNGSIARQNILPEILFITSFPPRECGIATYSQDLVNALGDQFENSFQCTICALESDTEQHTYKQTPEYILNTDHRNSFVKTAFNINRNKNIKLVVMQHEFGFFATKEHEFKLMFDSLVIPTVFVFHTVLPHPNIELREKVQNMADIATSIIVMTVNAATILKEQYSIAAHKISVIPHGTHLVPPLEREEIKELYHLSGRKVLSTFGLLSSSKSIETTLQALPTVVSNHPEVLFLAIGKTHPNIVKQEGEQYRRMLEEKVETMNLQGHVVFVNEYLPLPTLLEYLQLTDIYLFTSKDSNQAVSGTFSYAVSCGCPVISTPIPHAKEVLSHNNGIIIDFEDAKQLSKEIIALLDDEQLRSEISCNSFHKMTSTAWQNSAIAHALLFKKETSNAFQLNFRMPKLNINHIRKMTTDVGMIQFSNIANPDIHSGYTLDDNARALIAICRHYMIFRETTDLTLISTYLNFIQFCFQPNGKFLNYVNEQKEFTDQNNIENLDDSNGRAIWALGFVISYKKILPVELLNIAEDILQQALPYLDTIYSTRAMAFIIKGLHYQNKKENFYLMKVLTDRLMQMYQHEKTSEWLWFESYLTYGNSLLPEAMLCAYLSTNNNEYKRIAQESFDFLLSKIFINGTIKVISNKGWLTKNPTMDDAIGGEQPIDVAYTIIALENFYSVFKREDYKQKAIMAFSWFLGNNHLHQIVYNPCTGGCYDGIEKHNININQGAESTVCFLMARLSMERILHNTPSIPRELDRT